MMLYDAKDRLVNTIDPLGRVMTYTYDAVNNRIALIDPLGRVTQYGYDALDRRTTVTDALGQVTTFAYDENGNRVSLTDANGHTTTYAYDARNLLVSVTDAAGGMVSYAYDANGNRVSMTDANGHVTQYGYDPLDRLLSVTDPLSQTVSYLYDAVGNRLATNRADGTAVNYSYDPLYRLTATGYPSGTIQYSYDPVGNRLAMTDTLGVTGYSYDPLDRPVTVTGPTGSVGYGYDSAGNRTQLVYPDGRVVTYAYDLANQMTLVEDWDGRLTGYSYDAAGQLDTTLMPNGVQASYGYDDAGRLLAMQHVSPVSGTVAFVAYTLDAVGNRLVMTDTEGVTSYSYDALNRLTSVDYPGGEQVDYAYDPMGNRTVMTGTVSGVTSYAYDAGDRLLNAGGTPFTWDANGNQLSKGSAIFTFDALDRLLGVISGTTTVEFAYNGDGVRLGKTVNGAPTSYVQDVAAPLPVVLAETTAGQTTYYVYGLDLLYSVDPAGNSSYYHADGLGSTRALTNAAGQRTDAHSYDAFGAMRSHTGPAGQPFTFTGEQLDAELGLMFLRARYYDPEVGRFLSKDRWPILINRTQVVNRFVYVENNPTRLIDPNGLSAKDSVISGPVHVELHYADPRIRIYGFLSDLQLGLDVFNEFSDDMLEWLWLSGRSSSNILQHARNIGTITDLLTLYSNAADSFDRVQRGEVTKYEIPFEVSAFAMNSINDLTTGLFRSSVEIGCRIAGSRNCASQVPILAQLDQDVTGRLLADNIYFLMEVGPRTYLNYAGQGIADLFQ